MTRDDLRQRRDADRALAGKLEAVAGLLRKGARVQVEKLALEVYDELGRRLEHMTSGDLVCSQCRSPRIQWLDWVTSCGVLTGTYEGGPIYCENCEDETGATVAPQRSAL